MRSMTGFGRADCTVDGVSFSVEIRSVNSKTFDLKWRLPVSDMALETALMVLVKQHVTRGRVEVTVASNIAAAARPPSTMQINASVAAQLGVVLKELCAQLQCDMATAAQLVSPVRDLTMAAQLPVASAWIDPLTVAVQQACGQLVAMRQQEGAVLAAEMRGQIRTIASMLGQIEQWSASSAQAAAQNLTARIDALLAPKTIEPQRIAQEIAILVDRSDIREEVVRLQSHLQQISQVLDSAEVIGRKIEFILQEIHRELNTIGSKTASLDISRWVIDAKGCLEKLREQAQNIE